MFLSFSNFGFLLVGEFLYHVSRCGSAVHCFDSCEVLTSFLRSANLVRNVGHSAWKGE